MRRTLESRVTAALLAVGGTIAGLDSPSPARGRDRPAQPVRVGPVESGRDVAAPAPTCRLRRLSSPLAGGGPAAGLSRLAAALLAAAFVLAASAPVFAEDMPAAVPPAAVRFDPDAPVPLSPQIPGDVDPALRAALLANGELMLAHRLFERQQWAAFVALSWPVDEAGGPRPRLGDAGAPAWSGWIETYQVFKPDGADPDPWDGETRSLPLAGKVQTPVVDATTTAELPPIGRRDARVLHGLSSIQRLSVADEVDQAFSFAVFDQNGNPAHYESLLNKVEYDFIVDNELFHAGGLAAYVAKHGKLTFPAGSFAGGPTGAIELKLAWRVLDPARDDFGRYLTQPGYVAAGTPAGPAWKAVTVGLVGFHIAQKTETAPQWIWSTFEHVDNLAVDRLARVRAADGREVPLSASFNDAACEWCPVNVPVAAPGPDGKRRTQVQRLSPIPKETQALNAMMRAALEKAGSKLAFYEMVGTQWPTDPAAPPEAGAAFPGAVANMSGGKPLTVYLANSVMETFAQAGNLPADEQSRATSTSGRLVFGNGSCMGCHYTSPYDFSWIMTKAQPRPPEAAK